MKVEDRSRILHAIATARSWLDDLTTARINSTNAIAMREGCSERSVQMTLSLASISPEIMRAIIEGRLPRGIGIKRLASRNARILVQAARLPRVLIFDKRASIAYVSSALTPPRAHRRGPAPDGAGSGSTDPRPTSPR